MITLAAAAADANVCIQNLVQTQTATEKAVKECFLQKKLKAVATELDIQIASHKCWNYFVGKCNESTPCPEYENREKRCGYLGSFINTLKARGIDGLFSDKDAIELCRSFSE